MTNPIKNLSKTKFKVEGLNLENFLFKLSSSGMALSKIKKKKKVLVFTASSANKNAINVIAAEFNLKITELGTFGLLNWIYRLPYCIGSVMGLAFTAFLVIHLTSFIMSVEYVVPKDHVCKNQDNCIFLENNLGQIKEYISSEIAVGKQFKNSADNLGHKVIANFNLIESCSIKKVGTKVIISLAEADQKEPQKYTKIIAENNCIITSIITYSGIAKVKAGDVVIKGQTLVEADGDILPRAKITAKVYYNGMSIFYSNQKVLEETGEVFTTTAIIAFNKTILKEDTCPYKMANKYVSSSYITNWLLPIEKVTYTYKKLQLVDKYVDFDEVKSSVMQSAKDEALKQTTGSPTQCTYSIAREGDIVRVDCYLEVLEEIGVNVE